MSVLDGRLILVAGGGGAVGEGLTRQLLAAGAELIVPLGPADDEAQLGEAVGAASSKRLRTIPCDLSDAYSTDALRRLVEEAGQPLHGVVACLGGELGSWGERRLVDSDPEDVLRQMSHRLRPHLGLATAMMPVLERQRSGRYVLVNGSTALHPEPGRAATSLAAAAQLMLEQILVEECPHLDVNVVSLVLAGPVATRTLRRQDELWLSADDAGRALVRLLDPDTEPLLDEIVHIENRLQLKDFLD